MPRVSLACASVAVSSHLTLGIWMRPGAGTISPARNASARAPAAVRLPTLPSQLPRARSGVSEGDQREARQARGQGGRLSPGASTSPLPGVAKRRKGGAMWALDRRRWSFSPCIDTSWQMMGDRSPQHKRRGDPLRRSEWWLGGNECADVPGRGRPRQREYIAKGWLVCRAIIDARRQSDQQRTDCSRGVALATNRMGSANGCLNWGLFTSSMYACADRSLDVPSRARVCIKWEERQSDVSAASSLYKRTMEEMADRLCRYESAGACGGTRTATSRPLKVLLRKRH